MGNITDAKRKSTASARYSLGGSAWDSRPSTRDDTVPPAPLSTVLDGSENGVNDIHPDRIEVEGGKEVLVKRAKKGGERKGIMD